MSSTWHDIGPVKGLKFSPGAEVRILDRWIAVFPASDGYRAIDNACPHASAPLCDGYHDAGRGIVTCALHLWEFDLQSGRCSVGEEWNVPTYRVRQVGDRLEVEVPDR